MSLRNLTFSEGEYYHVYNRGVEKRKIFLDKGDHERFTSLLYTANSDISIHLSRYNGYPFATIPRGDPLVAIGAWCIMPNHFHVLLKEIRENGTRSFMQKLLTGYSMYFNTKYHRKGALFESRFSAKHVDDDSYLQYQYAYIHLNPIGIIDNGWKEKTIKNMEAARAFLASYEFSSLPDYLDRGRDEHCILAPHVFPDYFTSPPDFKNMIDDWMVFGEV